MMVRKTMKSRSRSAVWTAVFSVALLAPLAAAGRPDHSDTKAPGVRTTPGTARPIGATSVTGVSGVSTMTRATSILGAAWTADNSPIKQARLRLRNVISGRVEATTIANDAGQFTFENVEGGSYLVELVNEGGKIIVVGHVFTIAPGETVATFVRTGVKVPWFDGFFNNAVSAVSSSAASGGITAIAPVPRPVSADR